MSAPAPTSPLGRGTLGRQLVLRVAALVAAVAVVLSLLSTLAVRQIMLNQLDDQLDSALTTQNKGIGGGMGHGPRGINLPGLPPGTVVVTNPTDTEASTTSTRGGIVGSGQVEPLPLDAARELLELTSGDKQTVHLPGMGQFRAQKVVRGDETDVVALPTHTMQRALRNLALAEAALGLGFVLAAAAVARTLVTRTLRPLNRLAATAAEVSRMPLDRGEVALPVRVAGADADPSNEVGRVGLALNHMLNHVESALTARQQSEQKVRQFVADASHELRNPLAAITGYAELTRRGRDELPEDARFAMTRIEAEGQRMRALVEDMLLLARLDNDPASLAIGPVDLVELVVNATSDAQVGWPGKQWSVRLPSGPVVARGDAAKLHQVLVNLLSNANKHTPDGTNVEAAVTVEGPWALVTVTDDGPGIDEDMQPHVFERFARADVARARSGEGSTGLGLAIVAAVMQAHGGGVSLESRPGRTRFTLHVPLA